MYSYQGTVSKKVPGAQTALRGVFQAGIEIQKWKTGIMKALPPNDFLPLVAT